MITCELTTNDVLIKTILTEPKLFKRTAGQSTAITDFEIDKQYKYLLLKFNGDVLGLIQIREFTKIVAEIHIALLSKYTKKIVHKELANVVHKFLIKMGFQKVFTTVPAICVHVLQLVHKLEYKACGMIEKGIIYNNILCTLFLYEFDLTTFKLLKNY